MVDPLPIGATIGILGGGQLGRMLAVAASRLGLKSVIFDPSADSPAAQVANAHIKGNWDDLAALARFAAQVDVVTYEFENIPTATLDALESSKSVFPPRRALAASQDRIFEKEFLTSLGLSVAPFRQIDSAQDFRNAISEIGPNAVLKTRTLGYDGKGQVRISNDSDVDQAFAEVGEVPCVLEGFVDFSYEVSVIAARGQDGSTAAFDPGENVHRSGILHTTTVPARLSASQRMDAVLIAAKILNALDYVGVVGVELFVTPSGLVVNEIAPRVHNSGHWTQDGTLIDHFEQHIRAVAGWPLGDGTRHSDVEMENLIGDDVFRIPEIAKDGATAIHLYGKAEAREGRKMGHVNRILKR